MTGTDAALVVLVAASAVHLGFQLTVTMVVYPALARVDGAHWAETHARHGRAITPLVVMAYGALVLSGAWALAARWPDAWVVLSLLGAAVSMLTTALVAAPAHGRLATGLDPVVMQRLLRADRLRAAGAVVALAGALVAAVRASG
jgi:hypothetical protein